MKERIIEELIQIEETEQVKILYACESGSRAWGFPSKDSDYDVRFIYIRPVSWYLSIFQKRDVIERPISDMLDINGWDLKKALQLFHKSNPPLMEWLQSPIQYMEKYSIAEKIRSSSPLTFSPRSCLNHYLHMAKGNYREYLQAEQVKIKKYFYVLRPMLACLWIEKFNTMPPMEFDTLVDEFLSDDVKEVVEKLLVRKKAGDEFDYEPRIDVINQFLHEKINYFEGVASTFIKQQEDSSHVLDELFQQALTEVWS